jgi:hypothetical protein
LPGTEVQQQDLGGNGNNYQRVEREKLSRLWFGGVEGERLTSQPSLKRNHIDPKIAFNG